MLFIEKKGSGESVVLVHGFTLVELLSKSYQAIRYDLRGHGKSEGVSERFKHDGDLKELFETLKIDRAHIVGLSLGGWVAAMFAIEYPEMVQSLVLADSVVNNNPSQEFNKRLFNYIMKGVNEGLKPALKDWLDDPLFEPARKNTTIRKRLEEIVLDGHVGHGQNAFFLKVGNVIAPKTPLEERLNEINIPTLIIVGELDIAEFQENADFLSSGIKGAKKIIIKNAGHLSNMENPDEFNKALLSFLSEQKD
ncbi:MAG: alpha/beta fold hydrolase [Candidatus Hodarchaeales archaeon]|jgi:pimeloyl-ACP methyl ester carboxylesterase